MAIQYNKYIDWEVSRGRGWNLSPFHSLTHKGIRASGLDSAGHSAQLYHLKERHSGSTIFTLIIHTGLSMF